MDTSSIAGLSVILRTNEEVDQAAVLLRAIGLQVTGEDGYVEVAGPSINVSIMRGAMVDVPSHGGLLLQVKVPDVDAATTAAAQAGGTIALGPTATDWGRYSAFIQSPVGFTLELQADSAS